MVIGLKQEPLEVAGRKFMLREYPTTVLFDYMERCAGLIEQAVAAMRDGETKTILPALKECLGQSLELMIWVLREPTDGQGPATVEWLQNELSPGMRQAILDKVDELNGVERLGNVGAALLQKTWWDQAGDEAAKVLMDGMSQIRKDMSGPSSAPQSPATSPDTVVRPMFLKNSPPA